MIPAFNYYGYLPAGVHRATLEEVAVRFGVETELRRVQVQSLGWLVDLRDGLVRCGDRQRQLRQRIGLNRMTWIASS